MFTVVKPKWTPSVWLPEPILSATLPWGLSRNGVGVRRSTGQRLNTWLVPSLLTHYLPLNTWDVTHFAYLIDHFNEQARSNFTKVLSAIQISAVTEGCKREQHTRGLKKEQCMGNRKARSSVRSFWSYIGREYLLVPSSLGTLGCFFALSSQPKGSWPKSKTVHL